MFTTRVSLRHTTMFTYSRAAKPVGQSEHAHYLSYCIKESAPVHEWCNGWLPDERFSVFQVGTEPTTSVTQGCIHLSYNNENLVLSKGLIKVELPPWKIWKADVSNVDSLWRTANAWNLLIWTVTSMILREKCVNCFHGRPTDH